MRTLGAEAPERVEGPLSWVAWNRECLTAVRDRLGLEPLYYAEKGSRLAVGPRPAELLRAVGLPPHPRLSSLVCHLNGQAPLAGECFLDGVQAVEPGTSVVFERRATRVERHWRLEIPPLLVLPSDADYASELRELLGEVAVQHGVLGRAGVSMSAGLDSTTVAAILRTAPGADLTALHRCAPELPQADESTEARAVAERLGIGFESLRADLHWPLSAAEGVVTDEDSPTLPPYVEAWQATWVRARELGLGTVYTGAGGDHLFGGSVIQPYADLLLRGRWRHLFRDLARHAEHRGVPSWRLLPAALLRPLARTYLPRWRPAGRSAVPWLGPVARRRWRSIHGEALRRDGGHRPLLPARRDRLRFLTDARIAAQAGALARGARAHGVDLRHPLLDPRLLAFALSLPAEQCFAAGIDKAILRRAMQGVLPAAVLDRRQKVVPFAIFERGLAERETAKVRALITGMRSAEAGLVDERVLGEEYDRYVRGERGGGGLLWNALTLEDWLRRHH